MRPNIGKFFLFVLATALMVAACGEKKSGVGYNDYLSQYDPFYGGYYSASSQRYQGQIQITDRKRYQDYLKASGACPSNAAANVCDQSKQSPLLALLFPTTYVDLVQGVNAQVVLDALTEWGYPTGSAPFSTRFYRTNRDTRLQSTSTVNGNVRLVLEGRLTDSSLTGEFWFNNHRIGVFSLNRATKADTGAYNYNYNYGYYGTY